MSRAGLDKDPRDVARMFDDVAAKYDLTNTVLTGGLDRWWRHLTVRRVDARPGERVLDLAAGTGVSSVPLAATGAQVVACDFSEGMLRAGKADRPELDFVAGDGMRLPFGDASFDAVTISFGLRNFPDPIGGLREMLRVTRPGGRVVVTEFSTPTWRPFELVYSRGALAVLPQVAKAVSSDPESYVYLAESIRSWPDQRGLAVRMAEAGWTDISWRNLTGGIVALHHAVKGS
ncbi:demethylmenaquinone methyltransferase [Aeromicrobium sp. YIM 150415]|uniref:demethylmenaquinone methyltransferase n=1 Tax=Aeromicrobium sp. YIM 150415 TaxID=2803912 RepID=UPI0019662276|nr:demethylmenaquinone methyltransferase [Aeromicrobium sp. YIM 150415]MBM9464824.1 demethylmenaquinone methyltransferase [Aeromicrobium sp. YIM 150415]